MTSCCTRMSEVTACMAGTPDQRPTPLARRLVDRIERQAPGRRAPVSVGHVGTLRDRRRRGRLVR